MERSKNVPLRMTNFCYPRSAPSLSRESRRLLECLLLSTSTSYLTHDLPDIISGFPRLRRLWLERFISWPKCQFSCLTHLVLSGVTGGKRLSMVEFLDVLRENTGLQVLVLDKVYFILERAERPVEVPHLRYLVINDRYDSVIRDVIPALILPSPMTARFHTCLPPDGQVLLANTHAKLFFTDDTTISVIAWSRIKLNYFFDNLDYKFEVLPDLPFDTSADFSLGLPLPVEDPWRIRELSIEIPSDATRLMRWIDLPPTKRARQRRGNRTDKDKLHAILGAIGDEHWTLGEFLRQLFTETKGQSERHTSYVSKFLSGQSAVNAGEIVHLMYNHKYGHPPAGHSEWDSYFLCDTSPKSIKHGQPAMATWALQLIIQATEEEATYLCSKDAGLRVRATRNCEMPITNPPTDPGHSGISSIVAPSGVSTTMDGASALPEIDGEPAIAQLTLHNNASVRPISDLDTEVVLTSVDRDLEHSTTLMQNGTMSSAMMVEEEDAEMTDTSHTLLGVAENHAVQSMPSTSSEQEGSAQVDGMDTSNGTRVTGQSEQASSEPRKKKSSPSSDPLISWDIIDKFSIAKLASKFRMKTPVIWSILSHFVQSPGPTQDIYRSNDIVLTGIISELAFTRNSWTNYFPICRAISMFGTQAHQSMYRIGSRLGDCVTYTTVRDALVTMASAERERFQSWCKNSELRRNLLVVIDNVQVYARKRTHYIGKENKMITGTGATAVEMEDCAPDAFNLKPILDRLHEGRRAELSADSILADIDWEHLRRVQMYHWLDALVFYVPALAGYRTEVTKLFAEKTRKHQINPNRHTKVHPLGTNSANEVSTQGMKEALTDFLEQLSINDENLGEQLVFFSGDGKSFEGMHTVKKYLSSQLGTFTSFRFLRPVLELWHTKWTDLSRICRTHWGVGHTTTDPSTLGYMAARQHVGTQDLIAHYARLAEIDALPSLQILLQDADLLSRHYCGSKSFIRALRPSRNAHLDDIPEGPAWTAGQPTTIPSPTNDSAKPFYGETVPPKQFDGDWLLANCMMLMRNGIWFLEYCKAIALGDIGRTWEVIKLLIFTFVGAGNTNYTTYLVEMYCNITYDYPEVTREALFNNWLVNLQGQPGHFLELDLMQEHFNFWLEELAQHKGKEFDDDWYWEVLSMHVHHFIRLTKEMEANVNLKECRTNHVEPHMDNELREVIRLCREHDLHVRRQGRDWGFHISDDQTLGYNLLTREGKMDEWIANATRDRDNRDAKINIAKAWEADAETYLHLPLACVDGQINMAS
ncbi:hypothetical protein EW146_g9376 [Bondarzewia mesenterica]|uniref:DUF6589 domain-containing protein n=1 Tax=Bondarzewia mesenterica TaxID=1095465 RepID=A0A4S4L7D7_9AGAM|nr:hypothetical protein EW146_g9376 [Bondarzewia mesenterica]